MAQPRLKFQLPVRVSLPLKTSPGGSPTRSSNYLDTWIAEHRQLILSDDSTDLTKLDVAFYRDWSNLIETLYHLSRSQSDHTASKDGQEALHQTLKQMSKKPEWPQFFRHFFHFANKVTFHQSPSHSIPMRDPRGTSETEDHDGIASIEKIFKDVIAITGDHAPVLDATAFHQPGLIACGEIARLALSWRKAGCPVAPANEFFSKYWNDTIRAVHYLVADSTLAASLPAIVKFLHEHHSNQHFEDELIVEAQSLLTRGPSSSYAHRYLRGFLRYLLIGGPENKGDDGARMSLKLQTELMHPCRGQQAIKYIIFVWEGRKRVYLEKDEKIIKNDEVKLYEAIVHEVRAALNTLWADNVRPADLDVADFRMSTYGAGHKGSDAIRLMANRYRGAKSSAVTVEGTQMAVNKVFDQYFVSAAQGIFAMEELYHTHGENFRVYAGFYTRDQINDTPAAWVLHNCLQEFFTFVTAGRGNAHLEEVQVLHPRQGETTVKAKRFLLANALHVLKDVLWDDKYRPSNVERSGYVQPANFAHAIGHPWLQNADADMIHGAMDDRNERLAAECRRAKGPSAVC